MSEIEKAQWTTAYINDLPNSSFAYIEAGGSKDKDGKTVPRSLRHLPYKDQNGKVDAAHVRNALARLSLTNISAEAKASARRKLVSAARKLGVEVADEKKKILDIEFDCSIDINKSYEDGEKWFIEGYAGSTELDLVGDIITEEAFKGAEEDLLTNSTVLYNHDPEEPIGRVEEVKSTKEGLWVKILISKTVPEIWQKIKEGVLNKFSIRGKVIDAVKRFVKELNKVVNIIKELYLVEASLVSLPANPEAKALRWYISKSLQDFESKGGEIPKEHEEAIMLKGETMPSIVDLLKQITDRMVADEDKVLIETLKVEVEKACKKPLKKSGEEWTQEAIDELEKAIGDLQVNLEIEKKKKVCKPVDEMNDEDMKAAVDLSDEIRKKFSDKYPYPAEVIKNEVNLKKATGEAYTQEEVDNLVKVLNDAQAKIVTLEKELKDIKDDQEVEKSWIKVKQEYDEKDAPMIKSLLKKSVSGVALTADETSSLMSKKIQPSELKIGSGQDLTKVITEERKQELMNKGGIKPRFK